MLLWRGFSNSCAVRREDGSSKRGTRGSAIYHQFDRVDVGGILRCKEEYGFGNIFRLTPTASGLLGGVVLARAVQDPPLSDEILKSVRQELG